MLCVLILYINSDSGKQIFWETFHGNFICSEFLQEICWINTFCILFWCVEWGSNLGFSANKPTHYLSDHDDYSYFLNSKINQQALES